MSGTTTVRTRSTEDRVVIDAVTVYPVNQRTTLVQLDLSRWRREQDLEIANRIAVYLSAGPELELVTSEHWDLSVEGGVMLWDQFAADHRETTDRRFGAFLPELTAPDVPVEQVLLGRPDPDTDGGAFDHGVFQAYLGGRLEYYPLRHIGIGGMVRWYARENPWSHSVPDLLGPVGIDARSRRWSASVTLTYAR
jgi:hypothetical protein